MTESVDVPETTPVAEVTRREFWMLESVRAVVDAVEVYRVVAVRAVDDAYVSTDEEAASEIPEPVSQRSVEVDCVTWLLYEAVVVKGHVPEFASVPQVMLPEVSALRSQAVVVRDAILSPPPETLRPPLIEEVARPSDVMTPVLEIAKSVVVD